MSAVYIHKYDVYLATGGSEEGGWYYTVGTPTNKGPVAVIPVASGTKPEDYFGDNTDVDLEIAYAYCRLLNDKERERRGKEEDYDFTSVLSYRSTHYEYDLSDSPIPVGFPQERPHYE